MSGTRLINAGFLPLNDCMLLVIAREKGFAEENGIDLHLTKEMSWASIRDHMAVGHFDVAHMLAPMPIAFNAGLSQWAVPVFAPMALGLGGNAVTVSQVVWHDLQKAGCSKSADPAVNGAALKRVIQDRKAEGKRKLRFGVVHPYSGHNFELRYWLASSGIDPQSDVEILIAPPPLMPDALASGRVDGYCVGEPWNSVAVREHNAKILTTTASIWRSSPEKVLGVREDWASDGPELLSDLLRTLHMAAKWCDADANHEELAGILAREEYVGVPSDIILPMLSGALDMGTGEKLKTSDFFIPLDRAATFPWQSHALWFYTQMVRWGQISHSDDNRNLARRSYRPDIYRAALQETDAAIPAANMKVEGALVESTAVGSTGRLMLGPDGFFDGEVFDPDDLDDYILKQSD